jgi:hypothetical protein
MLLLLAITNSTRTIAKADMRQKLIIESIPQ